jgi:hypothetical protein
VEVRVIPFDRRDRGTAWLKQVCLCLMTIAGILMSSPVRAGGLWLYEAGTPDLGTAYDSSPPGSDTRTPDAPLDRQVRVVPDRLLSEFS